MVASWWVCRYSDVAKKKDNQANLRPAMHIGTALPPTNAIDSPINRPRPGSGGKT